MKGVVSGLRSRIEIRLRAAVYSAEVGCSLLSSTSELIFILKLRIMIKGTR